MLERDPNEVPQTDIKPYTITPMKRYEEPAPPPPEAPSPNFFQETVLALRAVARELREAGKESRRKK